MSIRSPESPLAGFTGGEEVAEKTSSRPLESVQLALGFRVGCMLLRQLDFCLGGVSAELGTTVIFEQWLYCCQTAEAH